MATKKQIEGNPPPSPLTSQRGDTRSLTAHLARQLSPSRPPKNNDAQAMQSTWHEGKRLLCVRVIAHNDVERCVERKRKCSMKCYPTMACDLHC